MEKEWLYVFDDKENTIDNFLVMWKVNMEILIAKQEKVVIIMDVSKANIFSMTKIMKIIGFISSNKRKLTASSDKIQILTSTDKQVRMIKNALSLSPVRICEFEILKMLRVYRWVIVYQAALIHIDPAKPIIDSRMQKI